MSNILLRELYIDGIPVLEYIPQNKEVKGLIFVQHGYTSDKSNGAHFFSYPLAKKGYKVVSVDAIMHGDRVSEPFISGTDLERRNNLFDVVEQTARDIKHLYEVQYSKDFNTFDFIGVSMGGMISYRLAMITTTINKLIPLVTNPCFTKYAKEINPELFPQADKAYPNLKEIEQIDPYLNYMQLSFNEIHIFSATEDPIFSVEYTKDFVKLLSDKNVTTRYFKAGHETPVYILKEIFEKY